MSRLGLSPRRALVGLLATGWLAAGAAGAYTYVHRYDLYRGFPAPQTPAGIARGTVRTVSFHSRALGQTGQYTIYLPPHYASQAARGRRFPVLYLLHGYPGQPRVFLQAGAAAVRADVLIAKHRMPPTILVMPTGKRADTEWANGNAGRWMDYVLETVHNVDSRFATLADRQHRGLAGLSEGGFAAINIGLRNLSTFSVAESWSGYYSQSGSGGVLSGAAARANSPVDYVPRLAPKIRRYGFRAWLYQGQADSSPPSLIRNFATELHNAGAEVHYGFFPGGHDWRLWRAQLPHMLEVAGRWFNQRPGASTRFTATGKPLPPAAIKRIIAARKRRCLALKPGPHTKIGLSCAHWRRQAGLPNR